MLYLENVSPNDTLYFKWYYEGVQVSTSDTITYADSVVHCPFNCTDIRNTDIKYVTGNITIEAYLNGSFNLRDGFYLYGLMQSTTTTSYSRHPTTTIYSPNPCMMSSIYGEDSEETVLLRYYRDNVLSQTQEGQALIKLYYLWSPVILKAMEGDDEFKEEVKQMIDGVLPMIEREMAE